MGLSLVCAVNAVELKECKGDKDKMSSCVENLSIGGELDVSAEEYIKVYGFKSIYITVPYKNGVVNGS